LTHVLLLRIQRGANPPLLLYLFCFVQVVAAYATAAALLLATTACSRLVRAALTTTAFTRATANASCGALSVRLSARSTG
jgi:hypothetical protein